MANNNSNNKKNNKPKFPNPKASEFKPKNKRKNGTLNPNAPEFKPTRNSKEYEKTKKAINDALHNIRSILEDGKYSLHNYKRISKVFAKNKKEQLKKLKDVISKIKGLNKDNKDKGKLVYAKKAFERIQNDYIKLEKEFLNRKTKMEEKKIKLYNELLENQNDFFEYFHHKIEGTNIYALPSAVRTILKEKYEHLIEKNKDIISHLKSGSMRREARKIVNEGNEELNRLKTEMNVRIRKAKMERHMKKK